LLGCFTQERPSPCQWVSDRRANSPPLPCSAETRWHKLDSRNYRGRVGGVTVLQPLHNWTIYTANGRYGLVDWPDRTCSIWLGQHAVLLPLPAPLVAAIFFLLVLLLLFAAWHFIGNLRHSDEYRNPKRQSTSALQNLAASRGSRPCARCALPSRRGRFLQTPLGVACL
jgi:hypothetical protein